ncbi:phosphodiester glycosidase family protein [Paenibacillus nasutitermitis]|uniref:Phosphodiester glycosidase domain-containing protein n=1 Tax=Paenibacillus nasutitermitis TaxID=1652958 RepID=A0A916YM84_9BACL|nr:phosphodiester glycosidase family protein [Paenibacillus nasutitermitis]GGD49477.1 hypothetical protein GCM10010911_03760 [Paenibacillus nasutitermitis]
MTMTIKQFNRFCLLTCAPFIGLLIWMLYSSMSFTLTDNAFPRDNSAASVPLQETSRVLGDLDLAKQTAADTAKSLKKTIALYQATNQSMNSIVKTASAQSGRPAKIYDTRITKKIGAPLETVKSDNLQAQLFAVKAQNFSGYALKVKLNSDKGMKMVLGQDKYGSSETTLAAVKRYKAVAGVNAGGFADDRGKRYPLSTTVVNGEYLSGFEPTYKDLFFVGLNERMELIGGKFVDKTQLDEQKPKFGASFVPVLLKNGVTQKIPEKWKNNPVRAPRTAVANYKDNQLLFLVVDGRNENGSSGATLEEMQILLSRFGAIDGYNLDGGGSSTLVFNGRVVNHPSDGVLRSLPTHFLFFK